MPTTQTLIRCPNCQYEGPAPWKEKGSAGLGCFLMFFFIIPGIIYFIWKGTTGRRVCPQCSFDHVVATGEQQVKIQQQPKGKPVAKIGGQKSKVTLLLILTAILISGCALLYLATNFRL